MRVSTLIALVLASSGLASHSTADAQQTQITQFSSAPGVELPAPWRIASVPGVERQTRYSLVPIEGRVAVKAEADASYANALHPLTGDMAGRPVLRFSWRVDRLPDGSDLATKAGDDLAAKVCVLFDLPLARLSFVDRVRIETARRVFDPKLPTATLCYVWDRRLSPGTWLPNVYTDRVRMLVLRSAAAGHQGQWFDEQRDLRSDFARAFGNEASGGLPPATAVAIATDTDNTGSKALAYYGDITLTAE